MFKGFYNLTSGMISQGKRLDVVSNNMANISTAGYKADLYTDSTFQEYMISRVGNKDKSDPAQLGGASFILAPSRLYTDYGQAPLEATGMPLDFGIEGEGFFAVQTPGGRAYTRNGSFTLDNEGYLCLPDEGRVLDPSGAPIRLGTDRITADTTGNLYDETGDLLGRIGVFTFPDNGALERNARGLFTGGGAQAADSMVRWQMTERSNVDLVEQMVDMITSQRALQSAAQITKMYNQLMTKTTSDLGRL